jgi:hypothetical protein
VIASRSFRLPLSKDARLKPTVKLQVSLRKRSVPCLGTRILLAVGRTVGLCARSLRGRGSGIQIGGVSRP